MRKKKRRRGNDGRNESNGARRRERGERKRRRGRGARNCLRVAQRTRRTESENTKPSSSSKSDREAKREKQLLKLVGAVVVGYLSQYRQHLNNEQFKKHAKEVYSFHLLIPHINHSDLIAHAYDRGTREKRCNLPFRCQTRGVVR
jgi:hypothetical protein